MKKIAKLSLVAAVAVAGLTTANAQPLEEAIKNVEVSGSVVYRYNDYNNNTVNAQGQRVLNATNTNNNYKVGLNLSSKVNEDVKFNSRFLVASEAGDFANLDTQNTGDSNVDVALSHAYFGYTGIANTTVNVGKQGLTTPWTVAIDSDGAEQTGTGILALSTVGPVTLAGAYFNQTNLHRSGDTNGTVSGVLNATVGTTNFRNNQLINGKPVGSLDIATVGAIANFDFVTVDAWYLNLEQAFDSYTIGAKSDFDLSGVKLGVDARYVYLNLDEQVARAAGYVNTTNAILEDNSIAKIALTAKAGIVNGKLAYAKTGKEGGLTAIDNDANTTLLGWSLNANNKVDADYWQVVAGVDVLSNLNLSANYGLLKYESSPLANPNEIEEEEIYAQLTYKMSKNLSGYVRYGVYTKDTVDFRGVASNNMVTPNLDLQDDTRGRLQVEYTF